MRMKIAACMMTLCLALLLTGCMERAADDVSNAVSRVESEAKDAASRVEDAGSRLGSCGIPPGSGPLSRRRLLCFSHAPAPLRQGAACKAGKGSRWRKPGARCRTAVLQRAFFRLFLHGQGRCAILVQILFPRERRPGQFQRKRSELHALWRTDFWLPAGIPAGSGRFF